MNPCTSKDSMFSSGKPKNLPWFFLPVMFGIIVMVIIFKWFD